MSQNNPGNVKFSLAQLAKEEEARKRGRHLTTGMPMEPLPINYTPLRQLGGVQNVTQKLPSTRAGFTKDDTKLGPATREMTKSDKVDLGENAATYLKKTPFSRDKPLKPNTLDAAADAAEAARAKQREGSKWVMVLPGR
jgi:hypothetical protein